MKTSELTGQALDWAVAQCEGKDYVHGETDYAIDGRTYQRGTAQDEGPHYSKDWAMGGPIIEREGITVGKRYVPKFLPKNSTPVVDWTAQYFESPHSALEVHRQFGPTPLIAAMRCYVACKLGEEIKTPWELS